MALCSTMCWQDCVVHIYMYGVASSHTMEIVMEYEIYEKCNQRNRNTGAMHESWWVISRSLNDYVFNVAMIVNNLIIIELIEYLDKK